MHTPMPPPTPIIKIPSEKILFQSIQYIDEERKLKRFKKKYKTKWIKNPFALPEKML